MNDFYVFDPEDARRFAAAQGVRTKITNNELVFTECVYCRSRKDKYTFSISLKTGQFQCKRASCGAKGNMITLAKDFNFDLGRDVNEYYAINNREYKTFKNYVKREVDKIAIDYMKTRGISQEVTQRYQITVHRDDKNKLVFPFLDDKNTLCTIKYRFMNFDKSTHRNKEIFEAGMKPILFGIYQCVDSKRLIITEGQIDALSVVESGINNAVSVPNGANGFTWVPYCWDWVNRFEEIVVFGDNDTGDKITLVDAIKSRFSRSIIKAVRIAAYRDCTDANELLLTHGREAVKHAVNNAETVLSDGIKRAEDVERINYADIPAFTTGVHEINELMEGGLRGGDLLVVSGERGDGKSTWVSQMGCFFLNNADAKLFMYSGELVDSQVMEWMHSQLAGTKNYDTETLNKMRAWYSGRLYLYDNEYITDDANDVYNRCVTAIEKYGCNIIILDNLMSAMGSNDADIYRAQSKFTRDCARMAKEYKVVVILIAHPNKNGMQGNNNAISGSADITNNATYIMWYQRSDKLGKDARNLIISKNRTNGKLIKEGELQLKYDETSRRIFTDSASDLHFNWSAISGANGFYEVTEADKVPF